FCILRAPICRMSAYSATSSTSSVSRTSVMTFNPVRLRASDRSFSPSSASPWKSYGEVRGLYAPPRRILAPDAATAAVVDITWCSPSHHPAPRHNDEAAVADGYIADLNRAPLLLDLTTYEFKRLEDRKSVFDSVSRFHLLDVLLFVAGAYGGYDGSF